jgi:hypothetical protein
MKNAANKANRTARPTFYEIVVEGHPELARGLLAGLRLGAGGQGTLHFSEEEGIVPHRFGSRIKEMVGLHAAVHHVIVDGELRGLLRRYEKRLAKDYGVRLGTQKRIRGARFTFEYHAYARRYGQEIQRVLKARTKGLKLEGGKPKETLDPSARGIEAYSPAHHYEVKGKGAVSGRVDQLVAFRKILDEHPLVQVSAIKLDAS